MDLKPSPHESPIQPEKNKGSLDRVPINLTKVKNPDRLPVFYRYLLSA